MPKVSKVKTTKPKESVPFEERTDFFCCRCAKKFTRQKGNFPATQSNIYKGNGGYLPFCNHCVEELYDHYKRVLNGEKAAMRRICMKFDIYWSPEIYESVIKNGMKNSKSLIRTYISRTNLYRYIGKTYDDTLDEENRFGVNMQDNVIVKVPSSEKDGEFLTDSTNVEIDPKIVEFWGAGFDPNFYLELERKYKQWTSGIGRNLEKGEEAIYKQVCILEATINRDSAAGKSIDKNVNTLNILLGSANLKPSQKSSLEANSEDAAFDNMSFGVGIRMFENSKPIPKPDPDFEDKDGIIKYITTWFLGHLCKMLGIKNAYCRMYEKELEKMRIENPDLDEEDDEDLFNNIFSDDA